jgi:hypothetical protein
LETLTFNEIIEICPKNTDVCYAKVEIEDLSYMEGNSTTHVVLLDLKKGCGKKADLETDLIATKDGNGTNIPGVV